MCSVFLCLKLVTRQTISFHIVLVLGSTSLLIPDMGTRIAITVTVAIAVTILCAHGRANSFAFAGALTCWARAFRLVVVQRARATILARIGHVARIGTRLAVHSVETRLTPATAGRTRADRGPWRQYECEYRGLVRSMF